MKKLHFDYNQLSEDFIDKVIEVRKESPQKAYYEIEKDIWESAGIPYTRQRALMRRDHTSNPRLESVIRILNFLGTSASKYERYK